MAIRNGLESRNPNLRKAAQKKLAAVQDATAVPALELVYCCESEPMALVGIDHFGDMRAAAASLALARQALFSRWPEVRKAAVQKLKQRERETFVPELLSAMHSPIQSRIEAFQEPDGRLLYRQEFYRTGQDRDELVVLDNFSNNSAILTPSAVVPGVRGANNGQTLVEFDDGGHVSVLPNGTVLPVGPQSFYDKSETPSAAAAVRNPRLRFQLSQGWSPGLAPVDPARAAAAAKAGAAATAAAADAQATQASQAAIARFEMRRRPPSTAPIANCSPTSRARRSRRRPMPGHSGGWRATKSTCRSTSR